MQRSCIRTKVNIYLSNMEKGKETILALEKCTGSFYLLVVSCKSVGKV